MAVPQLADGNGVASETVLSTATTTTTTGIGTGTKTADFDAQVQELSSPSPQSFTLVATLQLLDPFDTRSDVFLMTRSYLQNWLIWAYHQPTQKNETSRVDAALRLAAERFGLKPPQTVVSNEFAYADPGPIDVTLLSIQGHDLLLTPNVIVKEGQVETTRTSTDTYYSTTHPNQDLMDAEFPELLRRVKSLPMDDSAGNEDKKDPEVGDASSAGPEEEEDDTMDIEGDNLLCCAVPERFYEVCRHFDCWSLMSCYCMLGCCCSLFFSCLSLSLQTLRSVIGVMCDDGFSVSMQPYAKETHALIHHHPYPVVAESKDGSSTDNHSNDNGFVGGDKETINGPVMDPSHSPQNGHSNGTYAGAVRIRRTHPRPIEFKRKIVMKRATPIQQYTNGIEDTSSPMSKLLKEQERLSPPRFVPAVEVYPVKLNYRVVDTTTSMNGTNNGNSDTAGQRGFVLVSRRTRVYDALHDLMVVTAPNTTSDCKRVWSQRIPGTTAIGDGYEVVELESLDGKLIKKDKNEANTEPSLKPEIPSMLIGEWMQTHQVGDMYSLKELEVIVEVKRPSTPWPREALQLENRIQVGDFVDAQDVTGKWYEAIVREVTDSTVKVHYMGWASRWDALLRRRKDVVDDRISPKLNTPAPLWSHCRRWREALSEGNLLEVRDSLSRADRPKWYKGIVRKVGSANGSLKSTEGGAELELFDDPSAVEEDDNSQNGPRRVPLLLMMRTQQVLIEVEQERQNIAIEAVPPTDESDESISVHRTRAQPPFLRWVNLFGEEICEAGTHMKIEADGDLTVVTLRYEYEAGRKPVEIMKSWNGMYGQGLVKEAMRGTPPAPGAVGMHNLGNSCYLNSIVQCLNHINPLTEYFLEEEYTKDVNRKNPLGSGGMVANAYATLLKEIWSGDYSALAPRLLKQTVANFAPQFNNSYQHDSQEFCQFLMDGIHEDCNRVETKPYVEELEGFGMEDEKAAFETWRKHLLRHDSIIVDRCQGMHRSHLTCPSCGRESVKFDVFSTISLPLVLGDKIGPSSTIKVEECIEKFLEGEQLDDLNAWYCPGCKKHVCALKMIALWSVPDVLILHLKRFQFENCSVSNNLLRSKIDDTIRFPIDGLDLTQHVLGPIDEDAPPIYNLFGVSEHVGATANSGHYTATVRNTKDGRWYRYNDAHVGETSGDAAVNGGAYLLFYQRAKGKARWAGMEKAMKDREIDPYGGMETDAEGFTKVQTKKKK